jgi:hypothetical protein
MTCLNAFYRLAIPPAWTGRLEPMPKKSNNKGVEAIFCKFKKIVRKNVHKTVRKIFLKLYVKMYIKIFLLSSSQEVTQKAATMTLSAGRSRRRHATPQ